jgi:hypothetical protein
MCRPLTWKETAPLRGHTVTLSFGLKFGAGFPQNEENHGFNIAVYGTTRAENQASPNKAGEFPYLKVTPLPLNHILTCTTESFTRQSFSFTLAEDVAQISIYMDHIPLRNGADVGDDYKFYFRRPALRIGGDGTEPELPTRVEDVWSNYFRFQRVLVTYSGSVTSGQAITQRISFPIPMEDVGTITCIRGYDEVAPVGFPAAARGQASSITNNDFVITRTASATSSAATFRTWYSFGILLWTFDDDITSF